MENNTFTEFLNDSLPIIRMNGEIIKISNKNFSLNQSENIIVSFAHNDDKFTTTIDIKEEFSITIRYFMYIFQMEISLKNSLINTSGLCGTNDGNPENDFMGPNGYVYDDPWKFGKTWEINRTLNSINSSWSWQYSNFNYLDVMDERFNESYLMRPQETKLKFFSNHTLENAFFVCKKNDLKVRHHAFFFLCWFLKNQLGISTS